MRVLLDGLRPRLFPGLSFKCVKHEGKTDLERSIPRKLRAWREPGVRFAVVRDNDGGNCRARKEALRGLCEAARRPDTLIRLACQELEAWYLGEPEALAEAFRREALRDLPRRARIRDSDAVPRPHEVLERLVPEFQKVPPESLGAPGAVFQRRRLPRAGTTGRLLTAVSASQAGEVEKLKMELLRVRFDEQARGERRKQAGLAIGGAAGTLKPWREVVAPHADVASGRYQQAEFAADLWQAYLHDHFELRSAVEQTGRAAPAGDGDREYLDPIEFFRRTYLTESLKGLLAGAARRITGGGGDPVVQLQTNFGGGKTHSMLAVYQLCAGVAPSELAGVDALMREAGAPALPAVRRVVLVGNRISPGNPVTKPDGTVVRTLWGELAWQLGGAAAHARDDEHATSPGDTLRQLLVEYGPCLILIDEWVAYARQLHDQSDLPAGSFETQFTFAQALTESVKLAGNCLLVVSLPASDSTASPHAQADDVEVGGQWGREALDRLRNVIGRIESSWRPASAEEGFEIVRRRLFEPSADAAQFKDRDVVARVFADLYRGQHQEFPAECRDADYEQRIKAAYPIHPEVFDRLYGDWSTLVTFAPSSCAATRARWHRPSGSGCAPPCARPAASAGSMPSRGPDPTCRTNARPVWWCSTSISRIIGMRAPRRRRRPPPSWRTGGPRRGSTATRSSSSRQITSCGR